MWCANEACGPCTAITHVVRPSIGPRASGTRLASPLRRPVVSSTTHQGAMPAARRATGLKRRQKAIAIARRRACFAVMTRLSRNPATVPRRLEGTCFTMIETARLQLEPLTPEHADDLFDSARGRGFAREAVAALLDACGCREALARVDARN